MKLFFAAAKDWMIKLEPAGKEEGHGVQLGYIPHDPEDPQYCLTDECVWNQRYPPDTLMVNVRYDIPMSASSTVGWQKLEGEDSKYLIDINPNHIKPEEAYIITHELGEIAHGYCGVEGLTDISQDIRLDSSMSINGHDGTSGLTTSARTSRAMTR